MSLWNSVLYHIIFIEEMGQKCCSLSQNTPEIFVQPENASNLDDETAHVKTEASAALTEENQKLQFYGKGGQKYSKTKTKQISLNLRKGLEHYRGQIVAKQSTIRQQTNQQSASCQQIQSTASDPIDAFLLELAEQVSTLS